MSKSGEDRSSILVVEDSKTQAAVLQMMLKSEGYAVDVVHDAEEALERARGGGYDVVLMDIVLPGLSGLEACRVLKEDPATRATPVVLVTQLTSAADMLDGLQAGADSYVTKPYQKTQILDRIGRLLLHAVIVRLLPIRPSSSPSGVGRSTSVWTRGTSLTSFFPSWTRSMRRIGS